MKHTEIDGVTVHWEQADGPLQANLYFACGHRDEDFATLGLTDLLRQLIDPDGVVLHSSTVFSTSGTPEQVTDYLSRVCRDLTTLPLHELDQAVRKFQPESRSQFLSVFDDHLNPHGSLLSRRYGSHGLGLTRWPAVDCDQFTAEELRAHAARYFTRGNAVLTLSGPPPTGLRLPLPAGNRNVHEPTLRQAFGPIWYQDEVRGTGILMRCGADPAAEAAWWLLFDRVDAAVKRLGYSCTFEVTTVSPGCREIGLTLQPKISFMRPTPRRDSLPNVQMVAETVWAQVLELAQEGPAQAEIDALAPQYTSRLTDPDFEQQAEKELFGISTCLGRDDLAKIGDLRPHDVRAAAATWLSTALIVVPRGAKPDLPGFAEDNCPTSTAAPAGEVFRPSLRERMRGRVGAFECLVLNESGVFTVDSAEAVHSTPTGDLLVLRQGSQVWLGNLRHQCLTDISGYAKAGDLVWEAAPPSRRRQAF